MEIYSFTEMEYGDPFSSPAKWVVKIEGKKVGLNF